MPQRHTNGSGADAEFVNALAKVGEGYGWLDGVGATLVDSTTAIELRVAPGVVQVAERIVPVAEQTVTLQPGDPQNPRKDLVWVDRSGVAKVRGGLPADPKPTGASRFNTYDPAPPDAAGIDGVPVAAVWVPAGADTSADIDGIADIDDRRQASAKSTGTIPAYDADPADEELLFTRMWFNETLGEWRGYAHQTEEKVRFNVTSVTDYTGVTRTVPIELFDASPQANWRGGRSRLTQVTTVANTYQGPQASAWTENTNVRKYSLPGDGLPYYPEPGDTIRIAFDVSADPAFCRLGFAKEEADYFKEIAVVCEVDAGRVSLIESDTQARNTTLGSTGITYPNGWVVAEVQYDGGGQGVHPVTVYEASPVGGGGSATVGAALGTIPTPTASTKYRGRGVSIHAREPMTFDHLVALK